MVTLGGIHRSIDEVLVPWCVQIEQIQVKGNYTLQNVEM